VQSSVIWSRSRVKTSLRCSGGIFGCCKLLNIFGCCKLLNSVNTEYQKRVMDRLQKLSGDLYSEFDPSSPAYWANGRHFKEVEDAVKHINYVFTASKSAFLEDGDFPYPCGYTGSER
jgi:hypothetical protein